MFSSVTALFGFDVVTISGTVVDGSNNPLPGANVILINTPHGGVTDLEGFYSIEVPTNIVSDNKAMIRASFIGFRSAVNSVLFLGEKETTVNFILVRDVLGLETVVVTGLGGLEEKKKLGVLIESVKPEAAQKSGETNIITALRGNVPGLEIRKTSGDAGTNAYFRIRGTGTISGGHEPLIIVDGSPVNSNTRTVG